MSEVVDRRGEGRRCRLRGRRRRRERRPGAGTPPRRAGPSCPALPRIDELPHPLGGVEVARQQRGGLGDAAVLSRAGGRARRGRPRPGCRSDARRSPPRRRRGPAARRAMFASSVRNGAADAAISRAVAGPSPPASRKPSRRWIRWLFAGSSQARRTSSGATRAAAKRSAPATSTWCAMMSPYSSGKTSSVRRNSSRSRISGTASAARRQAATSGAQRARSSKPSRSTSTIECTCRGGGAGWCSP